MEATEILEIIESLNLIYPVAACIGLVASVGNAILIWNMVTGD